MADIATSADGERLFYRPLPVDGCIVLVSMHWQQMSESKSQRRWITAKKVVPDGLSSIPRTEFID